MANYTAQDVKKLREETDAPMMECKSALEESEGDFARAKEILREKGKAQAGKKAGRATGAGVAAFAVGNGSVAGVVLETETDFVSRNEGFVALAQKAADALLADANADLSPFVVEAVASFRENAALGKTARKDGAEVVSIYVHHDKTKAAAVLGEGDAEALRQVAIHAVAFPPAVVSKDQLSQEMLEREIEIETQRAMNEGKPENIAKNIAQGRVNKEYIKAVVLTEQPFYKDPSKSVGQWLQETAKGTKITDFIYLGLGLGEAQ
ncbi:translation elongation factor Ts [Fimbriimonas ginsengisoli]|nr:translation elongation factor Ts [Fimbriimonas ginsengisoli]